MHYLDWKFVFALFGLGVLLSTQLAVGEGPLPYHPGDVIRVSVTFEGPDADKIEKVDMVMRTPRVETNQAGFHLTSLLVTIRKLGLILTHSNSLSGFPTIKQVGTTNWM